VSRPFPLPPPDPCPAGAADLYAPHGEAGRFFNPWGAIPHGFGTVLRWWLSPNPYDKSAPPEVPVRAWDGGRLGTHGAGTLTWIGHASFAIEDAGGVALTDPHFGPRALGPRRKVPPGAPLAAVPDDAFAVLSHNHYDHLDRWTVERLPRTLCWYVPPGLAGWFRRRGVERVTEVDWWHSVRHGGWTLTALPAQHWSNRLSQRRNGSLWCSWLLDSGSRRWYFAGDSGWFHGFAEIGRRFPAIDVALLPIGAYEPRWFMAYQHMDPAQAVRAFRALGARFMVGMHWGVFDLTDEPVDRAPRELAEVLATAAGDGLRERVRVMAVGERWRVPAAGGVEDGGRA
jgi:N-acyl-phosphatidylethanolamine-hydrolysing phospholipase D